MENIIWIIGEAVIMAGLCIESYFDVRYKKLPVWLLCAVGGMSVAIKTVYLVTNLPSDMKSEVISRIMAVLVGLILILIAKVSRQAIGYGDGIVVTALGGYIGISQLLGVLLMSISIAGVAGLIFLVIFRKNRKYELPFIPFIFVSYLTLRLINI